MFVSAAVFTQGNSLQPYLSVLCIVTDGRGLCVTSHDAPHLQWVPDGQQSVLRVRPSSLAGGAQVVVRTNRTLEAGSHNRTLTAVTGDIRVQGRRRGHVMGRWRRRRRVAKGEWREGMEREVSTVLPLLWKNSGRKETGFHVLIWS